MITSASDPGEKLEESLHDTGEVTAETAFPGIRRIADKPRSVDIAGALEQLEPVCYLRPGKEDEYRNRRQLRSILSSVLPSMQELEDEPEY